MRSDRATKRIPGADVRQTQGRLHLWPRERGWREFSSEFTRSLSSKMPIASSSEARAAAFTRMPTSRARRSCTYETVWTRSYEIAITARSR
eukprot:3332809-Prymnesium_polylepis.1